MRAFPKSSLLNTRLHIFLFSTCAATPFAVASESIHPELQENVLLNYDFDSQLSVGLVAWNAPALPQLDLNGDSYILDLKDYNVEASGLALKLESRLFIPVGLETMPLGVQVRFANLTTESPALSFTVSRQKSSVRPRHGVLLEVGPRLDFELLDMRLETALQGRFERLIFLSANTTTFGPSGMVRLNSFELPKTIQVLGARPFFAAELSGAPFLFTTGYDRRFTSDGAGVLRTFPELYQLNEESNAQSWAYSLEAGLTWIDRMQRREHSLSFAWNQSWHFHNGLILNQIRDSQSTLDYDTSRDVDVAETQMGLLIVFRSSFM